jgi:AcrR family transcriptional regulator
MKYPSQPPVVQKRPGGRAEIVRKKVISAVIALIKNGNMHFSYNEVADLSGVNKTTLYRRWPSQIDLLQDVLQEHNRPVEIKGKDSWAKTLDAGLRELARHFSKGEEIAMNLSFISSPDVEESNMMLAQWQPIQSNFIRLIKAAQEKGEIPSSLDPAALFTVIISPLVLMTIAGRKEIEENKLNEIIKVLSVLTTRPER